MENTKDHFYVQLDEKGLVKKATVSSNLLQEPWLEVNKEIFSKLLTMSYAYDVKTRSLKRVSPAEQWDLETAKKNFISTFKKTLRGIIWKYFPPHKQNDCALGFEDEIYCQTLKEVVLYAKQFTNEFEAIMNNWDKSNTEGEQYMLNKLKEFEQWLEERVKEVKT